MNHVKIIAVFVALIGSVQSAFPYGSQGHTIVGAVADIELKSHKAGAEVSKLLGGSLTLGEVATWADKIKSGPIDDKDMDAFLVAHRKIIEKEVEHKAFHFVDIPFEETVYSEKSVGAHPYDLVHAITNCVLILEGHPPADPYFSDVPKRVALILLAHYVGDIHQPLHVGSGYITPSLEYIDPIKEPRVIATSDKGGNLLQFMSGELHAYWDTGAVLKAMSAAKISKSKDQLERYAAVLQEKSAPLKTPGAPENWAAQWATEILPLASDAHTKIAITGTKEVTSTRAGHKTTHELWTTKPAAGTKDWQSYEKFAADSVEMEMTKGGFRLAQICEAIWPDHE